MRKKGWFEYAFPERYGWIHILLVGALGAATTTSLYRTAHEWETGRYEAEFAAQANNRLTAIETEIEDNLHELKALSAFFTASSGEISQAEFRKFAQYSLFHKKPIRTLEWIPRVPADLRSAHEKDARENGLSGYAITERDERGVLAPAGQREEYFPVRFVEPLVGNEAVGYDMASQALQRTAMFSARDSGRITATPPLSPVPLPRYVPDMFVFLPVYTGEAPPGTVEERRSALKGFLMMALCVDEMIENALSSLRPEGVDIHVFDLAEKQLLSFHPSRARKTPGYPRSYDEIEKAAGMRMDRTIDVMGRKWLAVCAPTDEFISAHKTWRPEDVLAGGAAITLAGIFYTFTMLKSVRAAHAHAVELSKYQHIIETSNEGITAVDKNMRITLVNDRFLRMTGYSRDELMGKLPLFLVEEKNAETVKRNFEKRKKGESSQFEIPLRGKDGGILIAIVKGSPLFGENGEFAGSVVMFTDITERKRMEEENILSQQRLAQAEKMASLGVLAAGVAHEINNPNNFIMLNTPLMMDVWNDIVPVLDGYYRKNGDFVAGGLPYSEIGESVPSLLSSVLEGSKRIKNIVDGMKNYSRPGPLDAMLEVDVNAVIRATAGLMENLIKRSTDSFIVELADGLPPVRGNFQELEQVIINLVTNSCAALPGRDREIRVRSSFDPSEGKVKVEVIDQGSGIPEEDLKRVTEPFFTTKRETGGMGLGLTVSSGIIRNHGGSMEFSSEPGVGTTVAVLLPVAVKEESDV